MHTDRTPRRITRAPRFEWSAWLAAAFVLLVVAPALHAQQQQTLAPLYSAMLPTPAQAPGAVAENARTLETALAVFHAVAQKTAVQSSSGAGHIQAPALVNTDGSAHAAVPARANYGRSFAVPLTHPAPHLAPSRVFTTHVILSSALTAGEANHRSGTRNNRSHE